MGRKKTDVMMRTGRDSLQDIRAEQAVKDILKAVGEDPEREGLTDTPARFIKAMKFYCSGYGQNPKDVLKTFEDGAAGYDELIAVTRIPFASSCEHHLAPFFGVAHIAYVPHKRIVGLSKASRLLDVFARRLQVQERLTVQVADALDKFLKPRGVAVVLEAEHLCMACRGVQKPGVITKTSALRGVLKSKPEARAEFFSLIAKS